jgi:hypothetical protein
MYDKPSPIVLIIGLQTFIFTHLNYFLGIIFFTRNSAGVMNPTRPIFENHSLEYISHALLCGSPFGLLLQQMSQYVNAKQCNQLTPTSIEAAIDISMSRY